MDLKRKKELLDEAINVFFQLDVDLVSCEKIREIRDVLMIYSRQWGYDENLNILGCWSKMYDDMVEEAYRRFYEIREEKAKEERSYEVANDMIKEGFPADIVSKISHLDLSIVNL